jgi:hypothetical protein
MAGTRLKQVFSDAPSKNKETVFSPKGTDSNFSTSQIGKGAGSKIHIPSSSKFSSTIKNMRIK